MFVNHIAFDLVNLSLSLYGISSNDHDSDTVSPSGFVIEGLILAEVPGDSGTVAPSPLLGLLLKILDN